MVEGVYKVLGRAIAGKRRKAGLSQKRLGELLGKSRKWLASVEQGRARMLVHDLLEIEMAFKLRGDRGRMVPRRSAEDTLRARVADVLNAGLRDGSSVEKMAGMVVMVVGKLGGGAQ